MSDAAEQLFQSLDSYKRLEGLIVEAESEGPHLECKAPASPLLSEGLRDQLARAASGFSNTEGGVIIWGMSTTRHAHSGLDVLTQIEPIGQCRGLEQQIKTKISGLTAPPALAAESKILRKKPHDSRGVIITYIPKTLGDPVQSLLDEKFYFRIGDEFKPAPHEMIKRLFAATDSPDLSLKIHEQIAKRSDDGAWEVPIALVNRSSAVAEHAEVLIKIINFSACELVTGVGFRDVSQLNPKWGKVFTFSAGDTRLHRGLDIVTGTLRVKMKGRKRRLDLKVEIFANKMRARSVQCSLVFGKTGLSVAKTPESFLY